MVAQQQQQQHRQVPGSLSCGGDNEARADVPPAVSAVSDGVTFVMPKDSRDEMGVVDMGGGDRDAPRTYGFIVPGSWQHWLGTFLSMGRCKMV